jgi:hypothetical protein
VLNLDETVSVTENFVSSANLCDVIPDLIREDRESSKPTKSGVEPCTPQGIDSVWELPRITKDLHRVADRPNLPCSGLNRYAAWKMLLLNERPELKPLYV